MKTFTVLTTPLFDRLLAKLVQQHPELPDIFESAIAILKTDPHNLSRSHPAGVVSHPSEWRWCGYQELVGQRERCRLLEIDRLVDLLGLRDGKSLAEIQRQ